MRPAQGSLANIYLTLGSDPNRPTLVAIKGIVFDVSRNSAYGASGSYRGEYSTYPITIKNNQTDCSFS